MTKVQIIYWRDIPVQVRVKNGRNRHTVALSNRFQKTVHRAAYRSKAIVGDAYLDAWQQSSWEERAGDMMTVATAVASEIETTYSDKCLDLLARNKGRKEHNP